MSGREMRETPASIVNQGAVAMGVFKLPFRKMNLLSASVPGLPAFLRRFRLKEWQHYAIISPEILLSVAIVDTHYTSSSFCHVINRRTGQQVAFRQEAPSPCVRLAETLYSGQSFFRFPGYKVTIDNALDEGVHRLAIHISKGGSVLKARLEMQQDPQQIQPMVAVLPISSNRPMYSTKSPGPVAGDVHVDGEHYVLNPATDLALLDEHKAFYPFETSWRWATAAGYDGQGRLIAFNLTHNMVRDDELYNENGLWLERELHLLSAVRFDYKPDQLLHPWKLETTDKRCSLTFSPQGERSGHVQVGPILSDYHQIYGLFNGTIVDSAGASHEIEDLFGVTEHHEARF